MGYGAWQQRTWQRYLKLSLVFSLLGIPCHGILAKWGLCKGGSGWRMFEEGGCFQDPDELHKRVLRELTAVNARKFLIIFERLCKIDGGFWIWKGRKWHSFLYENSEVCGELQADQVCFSPGKDYGTNCMEAVVKLVKEKKMTVSSQYGFMKGNRCLTNLIVLYNKMCWSMNEQRVVKAVYLSSCAALDTVFHNILIDRLKWSVRWIKRWLIAELEEVWSAFQRSAGGQSLGTCSRVNMGPIMLNIFINYLDNRAEVLKPQTSFQVERVCCSLEEPQGTREMGWQEPCEIQQWECRVLLLGDNPMHQNWQGENWLERSFAENALGALVNTKLPMSQKYIFVTRKVTSVLGCIGKSFVIMLMEMILTFYLSLVRNLECCACFWLFSTNKTWTYWNETSEESQID